MDGWETADDGWDKDTAPLAVLQPGSIVAQRYRVISALHTGDATIVYHAVDQQVSRQHVALKTLALQDSGPATLTARLRLGEEGRLLAGLRHPAVSHLLDMCHEGTRLVLVLEYYAGSTLKEIGALTPRSQAEVLEWGLRLCDVLGFLHRGAPRLTHGSVQARHCLVLPSGRLVLLDFAGATAATPTSCQSDTRALALLLYNLLSGADHQSGPLPDVPVRALGDTGSLAHVLRATVQGGTAESATTIASLRSHLVACCAEAGVSWAICPYCQATTRPRSRHCGSCGSALGYTGTAELAGTGVPSVARDASAGNRPLPPSTMRVQPPAPGRTVRMSGGYVARLRAVGRYIDQQGLRQISLMEVDGGVMIRGQTDGIGRLAHHAPRTIISAMLGEDDLATLLAQARQQRGEQAALTRAGAGVLGSALFPKGYEDRLRALGAELDGLRGVSLLTLIESRDRLFLDYETTDENLAATTAHRHLALSVAELTTLLTRAHARRGRNRGGQSLRDFIQHEHERRTP